MIYTLKTGPIEYQLTNGQSSGTASVRLRLGNCSKTITRKGRSSYEHTGTLIDIHCSLDKVTVRLKGAEKVVTSANT